MDSTILVINSGSSSLKFSLLDAKTHQVVASGIAEELNTDKARITIKAHDSKETDKLDDPSHLGAVQRLFDELEERGLKKTVEAVGHRVVNGIDKFTEPVKLTPKIVDEIEALKPYAPLHNPAAAAAMRAAMKVMPDLPQVAVFDTAFHSTMPEYAFRYAVPDDWYTDYGVRRYGFHGTSYKYVSNRAAELLNIPIEDSAFVIAHLGSGASLAAVLNGESVDTTMGFTPLDGIVMGTRAGAVDPAIIPYMMDKLGKSADEIVGILNHESGLLGMSGVSGDQRNVSMAAMEGNKKSEMAMETAAYSTAKNIAAMMVALPRVDAVIFTAGAGENACGLRARIAEHLAVFGYKMDLEQNRKIRGRNGVDGVISEKGTPTMMMIRTNEELVIAEEVEEVIKNDGKCKGKHCAKKLTKHHNWTDGE